MFHEKAEICVIYMVNFPQFADAALARCGLDYRLGISLNQIS